MICSHGVFGGLSLFLTNYPNWLRYLWKVFYMKMFDRYTYYKRSWCGWLDGYLIWFCNISWKKWYSEENLSNSNNVWQKTIFRRLKSTIRSGMDLLFDDDFTEKEYNKYMPNYKHLFSNGIFWTICDLNKVLIKYTRPHTFLFMSDFLMDFLKNF